MPTVKRPPRQFPPQAKRPLNAIDLSSLPDVGAQAEARTAELYDALENGEDIGSNPELKAIRDEVTLLEAAKDDAKSAELEARWEAQQSGA